MGMISTANMHEAGPKHGQACIRHARATAVWCGPDYARSWCSCPAGSPCPARLPAWRIPPPGRGRPPPPHGCPPRTAMMRIRAGCARGRPSRFVRGARSTENRRKLPGIHPRESDCRREHVREKEPIAMNDHRSKADPWWYGTWEGSREARLDAALAATPAQRIAWLEDALYLAFRAPRRLLNVLHDGMEYPEPPADPYACP